MIFKKKKIEQPTVHHTLLNQLALTKNALDSAYSNFENVVDPDLIDSCIYELKAVQMRYKYLLNKVKDEEEAINHANRQISLFVHAQTAASKIFSER